MNLTEILHPTDNLDEMVDIGEKIFADGLNNTYNERRKALLK